MQIKAIRRHVVRWLFFARKAIESMRQQSERNGNSELTLDEINE
jgi:hypothetical protein